MEELGLEENYSLWSKMGFDAGFKDFECTHSSTRKCTERRRGTQADKETDSGGMGSAVQTRWGKALQTMIHSDDIL